MGLFIANTNTADFSRKYNIFLYWLIVIEWNFLCLYVWVLQWLLRRWSIHWDTFLNQCPMPLSNSMFSEGLSAFSLVYTLIVILQKYVLQQKKKTLKRLHANGIEKFCIIYTKFYTFIYVFICIRITIFLYKRVCLTVILQVFDFKCNRTWSNINSTSLMTVVFFFFFINIWHYF